MCPGARGRRRPARLAPSSVRVEPSHLGPEQRWCRPPWPSSGTPFGVCPTPPPRRRRHSPVPGPCGPAAAIAPACVVTVPMGSSTRDLLSSGSPGGEAEAPVAAVLVAAAAAGSSGPTSCTRVTTTGVDELA